MSTWLVTEISFSLEYLKLTLFVYLQSFADGRCSGIGTCKIKVHELVEHAQPCPLELSSYLSASYICIPGKYV